MNIVIVIGVILAAGSGLFAAISALRVLVATRSVNKRLTEMERRLLLTQVKLLTENIMSESFYVDQASGNLKKMMIEDAIADGTHTSDRFSAKISTIDERKASVSTIQKDAEKLVSSSAALDKLDADKLLKVLSRSEANLLKLRKVKKLFEMRLESYRQGEQFYGEDSAR